MKNMLFKNLILLISLFFVNISLAQTVGSMKGEPSVSAIGAFTYSIPLTLPPGIKQLTPQLAINYNSSSGNGPLGMGWNLSGLSYVTRVTPNVHYDLQLHPVNLDANDVFELDGQRLINTGTAGVYSTLVKNFSIINSYGTTGSGPSYFVVQTKDGLVYEYGKDGGSRMMAHGSGEVLMWALSKIYDRNGNYISFEYFSDPVEGSYDIEHIKYGGNSVIGLPVTTQIDFTYEPRNDKNFFYTAGTFSQLLYRLSRIDVNHLGTIIHRYGLSYSEDSYSQIDSITETGEGGVSLPTTKITWNGYTTGFSGANTSILYDIGDTYSPVVADYNGDGVSDIVNITNYTAGIPCMGCYSHLRAYKNTKANDFLLQQDVDMGYTQNIAFSTKAKLKFDYNGDGKDDLISITQDAGYYRIYMSKSNDSGFYDPLLLFNHAGSPADFSDTHVTIGNFAGNGKQQLLILYPAGGSGSSKTYDVLLYGNDMAETDTLKGEIDDLIAFDYDGDGKDEMFVTNGYGMVPGCRIRSVNIAYNYLEEPMGVGTLSLDPIYAGSYPATTDRKYFGDFNGDGKTDILIWKSGANPWKIAYSKGNSSGFDIKDISGIGISLTDPEASHEENNIIVADFNGDGKDDILEMRNFNAASAIGAFYIFYSYGNNTFYMEANPVDGIWGINDQHYFVGDFNGDGQADLLESNYEGYFLRFIYFHESENRHRVHQVSKRDNAIPANGHTYTVEYKAICQDNDYSNMSPVSYPYIKIPLGGQRVVKHLYDNYNGLDNSYKYKGSTLQKTGLGFKGFESFTVYNNLTHQHTETLNEVTKFETSVPKKTTTFHTPTSNMFGYTNYLFDSVSYDYHVRLVFPLEELEVNYINNTQVRTTYVYYGSPASRPSLDNYGEPDKVIRDVSDGQEVTTKEFIYSTGDPAFYNQCKPQQAKITVQRPSQPAYTRITNYAYHPNGQIDNCTADPGTPHQNYISNIYDGAGNLVQEMRVTPGLATTKNYAYSLDYKFLTKKILPLGHIEQYTYDKWGNLLTTQDINGLITTNHYDDFNRIMSSTSPTGITTTYNYLWASALPSLCPPGSVNPCYALTTSTSGISGGTAAFYDYSGRKVRTVSNAFDGQPVYQDVTYAPNNNIIKSTDPYFAGGALNITSFYYDDADRLKQEVTDVKTINTNYTAVNTSGGTPAGMTVKVTNALASPPRIKETTTDGTGKVTLVTEDGSSTGYAYHSNGKLSKTIINSTYDFLYTYDDYGNAINEYAPNKGITTNKFNARDQLIKTTDANVVTFDFGYDALGRLQTKSGPDGTYTNIYGSTLSTYGRLVNESAPYAGMSTGYIYDAYSRLIQLNETVGGSLFSTHYAYDAYNRVTMTTYPTGSNVLNSYNAYGYFTGIGTTTFSGLYQGIYRINTENVYGQATNAAYAPYTGLSTPGVPDPPPVYTETHTYNDRGTLWNAKLVNSAGTVINNYNYDFDETTGDLNLRRDVKYGLTENFTYDVLDRLTTAQQVTDLTGIIGTQHFDYTPEGNIQHKSDISAEPWLYNKYGVVYIPGPTAVIPTFTQTATYTPFDKVDTLTEGDKQIVFTYRPDNQRGVARYYTAGTLVKTRYYANNYEKTVYASSGITEEICYVAAAGKLVAMYVTDVEGTSLKYVLTDHQSSITHILGPTGAILEERSYDAWGRMRNPATWDYATVPYYAFDRGYTGEELLRDFNVINLNGRLYDPLIGRMFSVDPVIADPYNAQTYNAYSYALNNPLKYNDRNGENPLIALPFIGGLVNLGIEAYRGRVTSLGTATSAFCVGFMATTAVVMGAGVFVGAAGLTAGSMGAALVGGATGGAIGGGLTTLGNALMLDDYDHNRSLAGQVVVNTLWGAVIGAGVSGTAQFIENGFRFTPSKIIPLSSTGTVESPVPPTAVEPTAIPSTGKITESGIFQSYDGCDIYDGPAGISIGRNTPTSAVITPTSSSATTIPENSGINPFKGKSFSDIDVMFKEKGFTSVGIDPVNGKGSYFSPSGTKYYLDKGGSYKAGFEGPHVDIFYDNHPSYIKVKYFLDGSKKMYKLK